MKKWSQRIGSNDVYLKNIVIYFGSYDEYMDTYYWHDRPSGQPEMLKLYLYLLNQLMNRDRCDEGLYMNPFNLEAPLHPNYEYMYFRKLSVLQKYQALPIESADIQALRQDASQSLIHPTVSFKLSSQSPPKIFYEYVHLLFKKVSPTGGNTDSTEDPQKSTFSYGKKWMKNFDDNLYPHYLVFFSQRPTLNIRKVHVIFQNKHRKKITKEKFLKQSYKYENDSWSVYVVSLLQDPREAHMDVRPDPESIEEFRTRMKKGPEPSSNRADDIEKVQIIYDSEQPHSLLKVLCIRKREME
jgi:hypothetical protein